MKRCDQHYPILGNWDVLEEGRDYKVWKCPNCDETYSNNKHHGVLEFTTDEIKEGRRKHEKQLLQPFREGEVSKEYLDAYPKAKAGMVKEGIITKDQARNAKDVWKGDNY